MFGFLFKAVVGLLIAAAVTFFVAGHRSGPAVALNSVLAPEVTIKSLLDDPNRYANTTVRIRGQVASVRRMSLLGFGGFALRDDSGAEIMVLTRGTGVPPANEQTTVVGTFRSALQFGDLTVSVLVQD
jgi:hypothetical protein